MLKPAQACAAEPSRTRACWLRVEGLGFRVLGYFAHYLASTLRRQLHVVEEGLVHTPREARGPAAAGRSKVLCPSSGAHIHRADEHAANSLCRAHLALPTRPSHLSQVSTIVIYIS